MPAPESEFGPDPPEADRSSSIDPEMITALRARLLAHFDDHGRDLPWRREVDPYRIWVSEVMLQQTRVETVIPYYRSWMERFPTLEALAGADQEEVLQEWKGLGYYSRARNLHRAARVVAERHGGEVPDSPGALRELPGVGAYTAGAVASIAFQAPVPAVDGNVRRVVSRLFDLANPGGAELRDRAAELVDLERPGDFNQALMELGATVCTPTSPDCPGCPVERYCLARMRSTVSQRPPPRKSPRVSERAVAVAVALDGGGRTVLCRRPEHGLLGGLWEFPSVEGSPESGTIGPMSARGALESVGAVPRDFVDPGAASSAAPEHLEPVVHRFTHLRVTYRPFLFRRVDLTGIRVSDSIRVLAAADLDEVPLPVAQQKIAARALATMGGPGRAAHS